MARRRLTIGIWTPPKSKTDRWSGFPGQITCSRISGICFGFRVTRADMESARGAPIDTSGTRAAAGRGIGIRPRGGEPVGHEGRPVSCSAASKATPNRTRSE